MKWIKLVPWESYFFKETWSATSSLLDCEFFQRKNEKKPAFSGFGVWQVFLWINESPIRLTDLQFPPAQVSSELQCWAGGLCPHPQSQLLPHLQNLCRKSSLIDFISDSDGMDDCWFAAMKEHIYLTGTETLNQAGFPTLCNGFFPKKS